MRFKKKIDSSVAFTCPALRGKTLTQRQPCRGSRKRPYAFSATIAPSSFPHFKKPTVLEHVKIYRNVEKNRTLVCQDFMFLHS